MSAVLGSGTKLVYAADWTEYGAHVLDGGWEVRFPLDPLFSDDAVDAVGIDYYPPISDWRDGLDHADLAEARSVYDVDYLRDRLGSGEAFDWYYATAADRLAQRRTPITDGAYGKPWIFRQKDLVSWWSNPHVERANGGEVGTTAWLPRHPRRPHAGPRPRGDPLSLRSLPEGLFGRRQPGLGLLHGAHDRSRQRFRLGVGRQALV